MTAMRAWGLVALLALLGGCSCQRNAGTTEVPPPPQTGAALPAQGAGAADQAEALAALQAAQAQTRAEAMSNAVSMVHAYLGAVASQDLERANAHWTGGKPPPRPDDQALRTIEGLRAIRINNTLPTTLDQESPPRALEVPVALRITHAGGSSEMTGSYRVRRKVDGEGWEITSADLRATLQ